MFYCCDNCETMFSDNDSGYEIIDRDDKSVGYYCCEDCAREGEKQ